MDQSMIPTADGRLATRADLDAATARTAALMADPGTSPGARRQAAVLEEAMHRAYLARPGGDADLQAWAEEWAARYEARATQADAGIEAGA